MNDILAGISQMTLGTVQLGMNYGICGQTEQPEKTYAFSVLDCAVESGIHTLDTANNYGVSEKVIGEWLASRGDGRRPCVVTQIGPFDHSGPEALRADILRQALTCRKTLGLPALDILMSHNYTDYASDPETVGRTFRELKEEGIAHLIGISAYSEDDYRQIAASGFDCVQIPLNVFDWRQIENGGVGALAQSGMKIFVRSVFLQGLIFMKPEELDPKMAFCQPYLERYQALCRSLGLSAPELALSFILSVPGVTSVVLGCQTVEQVRNNAALLRSVRTLTAEEMQLLRNSFSDIDPRVVDPRKWFNHT